MRFVLSLVSLAVALAGLAALFVALGVAIWIAGEVTEYEPGVCVGGQTGLAIALVSLAGAASLSGLAGIGAAWRRQRGWIPVVLGLALLVVWGVLFLNPPPAPNVC